MRHYVLGFAFQGNEVLLCRKKHGPELNINTWNGIGGKVEARENSQAAMTREFEEETGLLVQNWQYIGQQRSTLEVPDTYRVDIYKCMSYSGDFNLENDVGEPLYVYNIKNILRSNPTLPLSQNLRTMIAHCLWGDGLLQIVTRN